jgi:hypothetical protein
VGDHLCAILGIAMLQDMLCDVVAILISNDIAPLLVELVHNISVGGRLAELKQALKDATAILMDRQFTNLATQAIDDELDVFGRHTFEGLLDDVVPIFVLDQEVDMALQLFH